MRSLRDDLKSSKRGLRYLKILDAVMEEPTFQDQLRKFATDKELVKTDRHLRLDATAALEGDPHASLRVAECILQERNHPKVHKLFGEDD